MKKDFLILLVIAFLGLVLFNGTTIQSVDDYYLTHVDDITPDSETVTVSINAKTVLNNREALDSSLQSTKYIPKDGMILPTQQVVLRKNDSVFDLVNRLTRYNKIQLLLK